MDDQEIAANLYRKVVEVFADYVMNDEQLSKIEDLVQDVTGIRPEDESREAGRR